MSLGLVSADFRRNGDGVFAYSVVLRGSTEGVQVECHVEISPRPTRETGTGRRTPYRPDELEQMALGRIRAFLTTETSEVPEVPPEDPAG